MITRRFPSSFGSCLRLISLGVIALLLAGCAGASRESLLARAEQSGFQTKVYSTQYFELLGLLRHSGACPVLHAYIEGDGFAWIKRNRPSSDPTPKRPVALELALSDSADCVLYLARPCQYVEKSFRRNCLNSVWTRARFAPEIIADMSAALDSAKRDAGAAKLLLTGYSGGGAVAALLAEERGDVVGLATVAGNLDHALWTQLQGVSPLAMSLNPIDRARDLASLPQLHLVSEDDTVMPPQIAHHFVSQEGEAANSRIIVVQGVSHGGDWTPYFLNAVDAAGPPFTTR